MLRFSFRYISFLHNEEKLNKKTFWVLSLAFAVRLAALFALGRHIVPETWEYDQIAINIMNGKGYLMHWYNTNYKSFCYPVYPFLTAVSHMLTGQNYFILELLHILASVATCYLIYIIGEKIFGVRTALFAATLVALHPGLIVYATKLHELTIIVFIAALTVWIAVNTGLKTIRDALVFGAISGFGTLTRPTLIFFLPASAAFMLAAKRKLADIIKIVSIITIVCLLVILPWTVRNYAIHKRWIFITTNAPEHFWRGNNPNASGASYAEDARTMMNLAPKEFIDKLLVSDEMGQYDLFRVTTSDFITRNPLFFLKMFLKKIYYFWWFAPQTGLLYPLLWTVIYKVYYALMLPLFLLGVYYSFTTLGVARRPAAVFILTFCAFVSLVHGIYYVEMRHRWAIEPFMLLFSAYEIQLLTKPFLKRR